MQIRESRFIKLMVGSFKDFNAHECTKLSASLSYYTIFALPSFAIFLIYSLGYFLEEERVSGKIFLQINKMVGSQVGNQLQEIVANGRFSNSTIFETIVGLITLLVSATGMFTELQSSINDIWGIETKPRKSILHAIVDQIFSFSMVGIFGLLLVVSLLIDSFIEVFYENLAKHLNADIIMLTNYFDLLLVFVVVTFLFFYIFKELPDGKIGVKETFVGAFFTSSLFMVGKWFIGLYVESSDKFNMYGAAGAILILLFWVYYSAIILYFGAAFTKNYSILYGTPIVPNELSEFKKS